MKGVRGCREGGGRFGLWNVTRGTCGGARGRREWGGREVKREGEGMRKERVDVEERGKARRQERRRGLEHKREERGS